MRSQFTIYSEATPETVQQFNFWHTVIFGIPNKAAPTKNMLLKKTDHKQSDYFIIILTESSVSIILPVPAG